MSRLTDIDQPRNALDIAVQARVRDAPALARDAIRHRRVKLAFQPVVQAAAQDRIAYHEALARVQDPHGRSLPAADFIRVIEEEEAGRALDCVVLSKGLGILARNPGVRLALNLSARSVGYRKYARILEQGLGDDPTIAERLILELRDASVQRIPELVWDFMNRYARTGISFTLDNFGQGPSDLGMLTRFPFDIIKVHGTVVRGVGADPDRQSLLRAILAMAREIDLFTVAEGIETLEDALFARDAGIDCLQGYFFAAPTLEPPWRPTAWKNSRD